MPISNPIIQGLTVTVLQGSEVTIANSNPTATPTAPKDFWFNVVTSRMYLAIATNSVADWIEISSGIDELDWNAITNKPSVFPSIVDWAAITNKPSVFPTVVFWSQITNKPSVFPADVAAILNKIVVENDAVLTDGENVIFEN